MPDLRRERIVAAPPQWAGAARSCRVAATRCRKRADDGAGKGYRKRSLTATVLELRVTFAIDIPSPCVGVCRLDEDRRVCEGCLRTPHEIARWPFADGGERLGILQRLRERRRASGRTSAADSRPRRRSPTSSIRPG